MAQKTHANGQAVCIQRCTYPQLDVDALLRPLGGIKKYVSRGERVLLKVNLLSPSPPEKAVVTHPMVVKAVAEAVLDSGGTPVIGDSPSGQFTKRRLDKVYRVSGLKEVAREMGVELAYNTGSRVVRIQGGVRLKKAPLCSFFLDADKVIALPKIKTHSLMYMTLATKIMYGAIPGLTKAKYHSMFVRRKAFADMLLDVLSVTVPDLCIMDGVLGMQGDGPLSGMPVDLGVMLASEDAVTMDLAVCDLLDIEAVGIPTLRQAKVRGMWPEEIHYPLLTPDEVRYSGFMLPSTASYLLTGKKRPKRSPIVTERCTTCGLCEEICPRDAIKVQADRARVDYPLCIQCYCCHEVCPENAITLGVVKSFK